MGRAGLWGREDPARSRDLFDGLPESAGASRRGEAPADPNDGLRVIWPGVLMAVRIALEAGLEGALAVGCGLGGLG